ncbi:MAG: transketolase [Chitinophagales bacterium]|jgi:transketolase
MDTRQLAMKIRAHALCMVHQAGASHIGSALSICDIVSVLYGQVMQYDPRDPEWSDRDRFILSKGHACVAIYAVLAETGFIPFDDLSTYGQDNSFLMNHISHKIDGVEFSTGALGHGLSFGVGKALSARISQEKWRTFVLLSDGEMDEGSNWEALMFAAHHKLENLTCIIDYNKLQSLQSVALTLNLEPLAEKLSAFGCAVVTVDGHSHTELERALSSTTKNRPTVVIANTVKGKGVSFMENQVAWHYKSPNQEELHQALTEIEASDA